MHIPEKGETFSGVLILVFVMELPAGGLYVTMKTSFKSFYLTRYTVERKNSGSHAVGGFFINLVPPISPSRLFRETGDTGFSDFFPQYIPGRIFFNSGEISPVLFSLYFIEY